MTFVNSCNNNRTIFSDSSTLCSRWSFMQRKIQVPQREAVVYVVVEVVEYMVVYVAAVRAVEGNAEVAADAVLMEVGVDAVAVVEIKIKKY
ncbi:hypothetical protein TKK_0014658 [Trichogramma kaykai]